MLEILSPVTNLVLFKYVMRLKGAETMQIAWLTFCLSTNLSVFLQIYFEDRSTVIAITPALYALRTYF